MGALPSVAFLLENGADANGALGWARGGVCRGGGRLRGSEPLMGRRRRWCWVGRGWAHTHSALHSAPGRAERSNVEGATPLHSAALGGCVHCARALLAAGADAGLPDADGRRPADLAEVCARLGVKLQLQQGRPEGIKIGHLGRAPLASVLSAARSPHIPPTPCLPARPPQDAALRELLAPKSKPAGGAAAAARRQGGEGLPAPKSAQHQFQALTRVRMWQGAAPLCCGAAVLRLLRF